jgi:hypothetical protein
MEGSEDSPKILLRYHLQHDPCLFFVETPGCQIHGKREECNPPDGDRIS